MYAGAIGLLHSYYSATLRNVRYTASQKMHLIFDHTIRYTVFRIRVFKGGICQQPVGPYLAAQNQK